MDSPALCSRSERKDGWPNARAAAPGFPDRALPLALLLLAAAAGLPLPAQPQAQLSGQVQDKSGLPIVRAQVRALRQGREVARALTGIDGQFSWSSPIPLPVDLEVTADGFAPRTLSPSEPSIRISLDVQRVSQSLDVVARAGEVSGSIGKASIALLETPQSISVVTREDLTTRAPVNMQEALRYTPGVRTEQYGFDARGDWATIRGGSFGQFLNGMRNLFGFYNNVRPEPFALEQIEVMRGPSSVLFGQGGFGGIINLVSKRPLEIPRGEIATQFGSFGRKQIGLDITGPAGSSQRLFYRLVGVGRDSGTQVNFVPDDRLLLAPSLSWRPTNRTHLTLLSNFQEDRMGSSVGFFPWRGTLQPHPLGRIHPGTFISEPGIDEYTSTARTIGYLFEHHFSSRWTVRQNFNYSHSRVSYQTLYPSFAPRPTFNADDRTINRVIYLNKPNANSPTMDTHAETRFRTGAIRHTFLSGFDFQQASIIGTTAFANSTPIDVFAPVYGNYTVPTLTPIAKSRQSQRGVYVQDQLKFGEHWSAMLGIRRDWASAQTAGNANSRLDTGATSGRAGLVYSTSFGLAPYVSYTESFLPIAGFDFFNEPFKPQRGKQWETGIKYEAPNGRVFLHSALFDIRDTNRRTPDPTNPRNSIQVGEVQSRGGELELRMRLLRGIDAIGSYSYNLVRVSRSNSADLGKRLPTMPLHLASLWFTKQWQTGPNSRLFAGPGIRYTGSSFDGNDVLRTPSYTLFDAMVAWETGPWRVNLNTSNFADNIHVTTCLARGDCFYGARRNLIGGISYRF
jgi:iron complex outermembrane receptor protein